MIKRTNKQYIKNALKLSKENVCEVGCGRFAWEEANTLCDLVDHTDLYPDRRFVQCDGSKTPFKDKEFDFVIASHVAEHVPDIVEFLAELQRIAHAGYIEVPKPLFDNLTRGNKTEHLWWVNFDDDHKTVCFEPKKMIIDESFWPEQCKFLEEYFLDSMYLSLAWQDSIEFKVLHV